MNVNPGQKGTSLRTSLTFEVNALRGKQGFPEDQTGLVFLHREVRTINCKYTGLDIPRRNNFAVRIDGEGQGWRIDKVNGLGPNEAVYDTDDERTAYFASNHEAAQALERRLIHIERNSTVGSA